MHSSALSRTTPQRQGTYVTSTVAQSYLCFAEKHGLGQTEFMARTGLEPADFNARQGRVAGQIHLRTLQLLDQLGIFPLPETDGFDDFQPYYPDLVAVLANSSTLREALRNLVTYRPVLGNIDQLLLREDVGRVMLLYQKTDSRALSSASGFGMFLLANKIANNYGDRTSKVIRIDLQGQLPGTRRNLEAVAGCRIRTDQPHDAWTLCGTALDRPFQCYNPLIARYARQRLDAKIRELNTLSGLSQTVRDKIRHHLQATPLAPPDGQILASLCDSLGTSRWTLRRHLSQEGCSFSELLTATRCEEMQRLLQYSELSIAAIGDQLGFATPGSLTRFARQHIGNSPSELRQITRKRPSVAPSFVLPNPLMPIVKAAAHSPCQVVERPGSADGSPPGPYPVRTGNSS